MDPQYHALLLEHAAALTDLDGAVVELQVHPDDVLTATVRIPGPPAP
jgi:hypothetical protein